MSSKLTVAYITGTMQTRFGGSKRGVELVAADYSRATEDALDFWNEYRNRVDYFRAQNVTTREDDPFSVTLPTGYLGVRAVYFLVPYYDVAAGLTIFELAEKLAITRLGMRDIALSRTAWEGYRRVRGVEPSWHIDRDTNNLVFYAPSGPYHAGYEVLMPFTAATQIPVDKDSLFLRLVEANCRYILAEIRGKFGGAVMAPGGGNFSLNPDYQKTKADELMEEIKAKLSSRVSAPLPFLK